MILIKNTQRKIKINTNRLKKNAQKILDLVGYSDFDLGIWLTTNQTIRRYNKKYRKKDKATDILSFPFYPKLKAGERIKPKNGEGQNLGDLIISVERVKQDAKELGTTLDKRMHMLLVHGILHLLGYDHIKDKDIDVMHKKEKELLKKLSLKNAIK